MNFADLHELLRLELVRRIESGALTGTRLAQQTGFQQAHISNFLNRKRALSLEGLDRVLAAQNITIDQILPLDIASASAAPSTDLSESVPVVSSSTAMADPRISESAIIEVIQVSTAKLYDNRTRVYSRRANWQRFVALRVDAQQAAPLDPLLFPGSVVVIDRHYNSLAPYHSRQANIYAVRCGASLLLRFVELDDARLIVRPYTVTFPVQLIPIAAHETPADYLVGRVCLVMSEL